MDDALTGVVLAGGLGTRFDPVTRVVNKHLLDVFDEPMVYHPIRKLQEAGIEDVIVVSGAEIDQFQALLADGSDLGVRIMYAQQEGELGIAHALAQARPLVRTDRMVVILGDNIYQDDLSSSIAAYRTQAAGAKLLLKKVTSEDARRFGVAVLENGRLLSVIEKPDDPPSPYVVTGCYMYDWRVFDLIEGLTLSERREYEITDVNNAYASSKDLTYEILSGWWTDAGTPASKLRASILIALTKGVTFHA